VQVEFLGCAVCKHSRNNYGRGAQPHRLRRSFPPCHCIGGCDSTMAIPLVKTYSVVTTIRGEECVASIGDYLSYAPEPRAGQAEDALPLKHGVCVRINHQTNDLVRLHLRKLRAYQEIQPTVYNVESDEVIVNIDRIRQVCAQLSTGLFENMFQRNSPAQIRRAYDQPRYEWRTAGLPHAAPPLIIYSVQPAELEVVPPWLGVTTWHLGCFVPGMVRFRSYN
jgi:hypothetical protein